MVSDSFEVDRNELIFADAESMPWITLYEGFAMKVLRVSVETGYYTTMFRGDAGRVEPRHRHLAGADVYVVSGGVEYRPGKVARAGSWMYEPAGALHTSTRYVEDTVGFAVAYGPLVLLDDDDNVLAVHDWRNIKAIAEGDVETISRVADSLR